MGTDYIYGGVNSYIIIDYWQTPEEYRNVALEPISSKQTVATRSRLEHRFFRHGFSLIVAREVVSIDPLWI